MTNCMDKKVGSENIYYPHPVLCGILKELCGIRDNTSSCDIANNNDIVALINDICTSN